jgi:hypothetical protein
MDFTDVKLENYSGFAIMHDRISAVVGRLTNN